MKPLWLLLISSAIGFARDVVVLECEMTCSLNNTTGVYECTVLCREVFMEGPQDPEPPDPDPPGGPGGIDPYSGLSDCWEEVTVSNNVTSPFNVPRNNSCGVHTGTDIGAYYDEVNSLADGRINWFYQPPPAEGHSGGFYMTVAHENGVTTSYLHLDGNESQEEFRNEYGIVRNQQVHVGQPIAISGQSGNVAPHLHVAMFINATVELETVRAIFDNDQIEQSDLIYCSGRTYLNVEAVMPCQ